MQVINQNAGPMTSIGFSVGMMLTKVSGMYTPYSADISIDAEFLH